ncbi:MAG: cupin domain-containing protein [Desulfuromonadaceae bacterium]|nr:cupin domain-containing protein [Desulfuromonas sp.]MDY0184387.1 cupin domain-containing protein [Desulfuromonadaceae bacterium]
MSEVESKLTVDGAHAYNLAQMTEYQEGAVVSRTLLKNASGTLTVFSFDAGQSLSEHTVPFNAFVQVLDGEGEITIDGKMSVVKPGEIILMPGGLPHSVHAMQRFKMLLTMFRTKVTE